MSFDFVPRKLSKLKRTDDQRTANSASIDARDGPSSSVEASTSNITGKDTVTSSQSALPKPNKLVEKYLEDREYAALLWLSLSDHAIWINSDLRQSMDTSEDDFIPFSHLIEFSPILASLTPRPSETVLVRSIRAHASQLLEVRMTVSEPDRNAWFRSSRDVHVGGYAVRRVGWDSVLSRIRTCTTIQWEKHSVYIENIPQSFRTEPSICLFLEDVLPTDSPPLVQSITFPRHRDDNPDSHPPPKCKGFAFVVFTHVTDAHRLCEEWPWDLRRRPDRRPTATKDVTHVCEDAELSGFRCILKKRWDEMKAEYLAYQKKLLMLATSSDNQDASPSISMPFRHSQDPPNDFKATNAQRFIPTPTKPPPPLPPPLPRHQSYPQDCLIFVKGIHPETNKTALRSLFSAALSDTGGIDYVDFTKGLDSCYLRLATPQHAQTLITHFTSHTIAQVDGLDDTGSNPGSRRPIEVELVQGKREEIYWGKVPEKIRKQAVDRAQSSPLDVKMMDTDEVVSKPKRKRRKHE
ncbi:hypothetical protein BD410DRAFT_893213 [Rickenella mellea]|uniref:XRRM domain-containing protein n=1 Tax=Rickenella mellea TaxID=50990 RepID=A0A4R5XFU4_9AGAM|nr:hypothetical protein BD410DRAFT_893213 [Rickenella mellea]